MKIIENKILTGEPGALDWYKNPTHEDIEKAFRYGAKYWGNFQALRRVTVDNEIIHFVEMIIRYGEYMITIFPAQT